jgi:hypothetical protein
LDQIFFARPSQKHQQRVDKSFHGSKMRKSLTQLEVT